MLVFFKLKANFDDISGPEKGRFFSVDSINLSTEPVEGASAGLFVNYAAGLFVNKTRNTPNSTSSGQLANGGLRDTLDVITQNLAVTLGPSFSRSFSSFASCSNFLNESKISGVDFYIFDKRGSRDNLQESFARATVHENIKYMLTRFMCGKLAVR